MYVPWLATVAVTTGGLAGLAFAHLALPGLLVLGVALVLT
jgi:predicted cobalt transporter CbtA